MCDVLSSIEEVNSTGVAKAVDGVNIAEAIGGQCLGEVLFADAIETGLSQLLTALIDKEAVLILGLWADAVFSDVQLKESRCFLSEL